MLLIWFYHVQTCFSVILVLLEMNLWIRSYLINILMIEDFPHNLVSVHRRSAGRFMLSNLVWTKRTGIKSNQTNQKTQTMNKNETMRADETDIFHPSIHNKQNKIPSMNLCSSTFDNFKSSSASICLKMFCAGGASWMSTNSVSKIKVAPAWKKWINKAIHCQINQPTGLIISNKLQKNRFGLD